MTVTIWHNPRCSKSRQTLQLVEASGKPVNVRHYLQDPPTATELREAINKLGVAVKYIIRNGEPIYRDLGLKDVDDKDALIAAMTTSLSLESDGEAYSIAGQ